MASISMEVYTDKDSPRESWEDGREPLLDSGTELDAFPTFGPRIPLELADVQRHLVLIIASTMALLLFAWPYIGEVIVGPVLDDYSIAPFRPASYSPDDDTLLLRTPRGGRLDRTWQFATYDAAREPMSWRIPFNASDRGKDEFGLEPCMTYLHRYSRYTNSVVGAPTPPTRSRVALLYRTVPWKMSKPLLFDTLYNLRALVSEVQKGTGIDLWILVNYNANKRSQDAWFNMRMHDEFKDRALMFSWADVNKTLSLPPSPYIVNVNHDSHMVNSWFFSQDFAKQYEFVWSIEDDVRMVGASWQSFFNNVNQSFAMLKSDRDDFEPHHFERNMTFPGPHGEMPDLVPMQTMLLRRAWSVDWGHQCNWTVPKNRWNAAVQFWGQSRHHHEKSMELYAKGLSCYTEHFGITAALHYNLTIRSVDIPLWKNAARKWDTFDYYQDSSSAYYYSWQTEHGLCRQGPTLLHPWKDDGTH